MTHNVTVVYMPLCSAQRQPYLHLWKPVQREMIRAYTRHASDLSHRKIMNKEEVYQNIPGNEECLKCLLHVTKMLVKCADICC